MDNVELFIEQLLKEKKMPEVDNEVHTQLVHDLSDRLTKLINRRVIESLPPEALPGLEKLLDTGNPDQQKIQEYISKHSQDLVGITSKTMNEFRQMYLVDN